MKKLFVFVTLLTIAVSLLAGCQLFQDPNTLSKKPLTEEVKADIKNKIVLKYDKIINWDGKDWNEPYYGTFDDCIIVQCTWMSLGGGNLYPDIDGYKFATPNPAQLYVYRNGEVCTLEEAYEEGWLTKTQIGVLVDRHREIYATWLEAQEPKNDAA